VLYQPIYFWDIKWVDFKRPSGLCCVHKIVAYKRDPWTGIASKRHIFVQIIVVIIPILPDCNDQMLELNRIAKAETAFNQFPALGMEWVAMGIFSTVLGSPVPHRIDGAKVRCYCTRIPCIMCI
jgi:hypothetical protein